MGVKGEEEEMEPPLFRVFRTKHNLPAFSLLAFMVIGAQEATLPCCVAVPSFWMRYEVCQYS